MEEILSQNEIDALLSALSSGEMDADELKQEENEKRVRVYDFKRALRFSKEQIRSIGRIHENYARLLTTFLSGQLRTYVNISVASVDQVPYEEFIRSVPKMTFLNIFNAAPLPGRIIMEINPNVGYSMLDRLLGGSGTSMNKIESLTEIETMILSQLFERTSDSLRDAWSGLIDMEPELEKFEVNPQFVQMVSPNDTVIVVTLDTAIGEASGMINLCIPHIVLEPVIPKLSAQYQLQTNTKKKDQAAYENLSANIKRTEVELKAILGETTIRIEQFLNMQKSDVIALDQPIDGTLLLQLNNEPKFYVQPGRSKRKMAVQILEEIKGGNESDG